MSTTSTTRGDLATGTASPPMRALAAVGEWVRGKSTVTVATGAFAAALIADGVGLSPAFDRFLLMAQHPMSDPGIDGTGSFVLSSPYGSWLASLVGATGPAAFFALHLALVVGVFAGSVWAVQRRWGHTAAKVLAVMWAALPLSTVLVTWVGGPDPLMVAAGTALTVTASPAVAVVAGVVAGATGGLQAVVLAVVVAVVARRPASWVAAAMGGVGLGVGAVLGWHQLAGIVQDTNRAQYVAAFGLPAIVGTALSAWQPLVWSLFAGVWPAVVARTRDVRAWLVVVGLAGLAVVTFDSTRVFGLMSWPLVVLLAAEVDDDRMVGWLTVAAVAVPPGVVWAGQVLG